MSDVGCGPRTERGKLIATIAEPATPDYVTVRAIAALGEDDNDRLGRFTAMGRGFVIEARRRFVEAGAEALFGDPLDSRERIFETATDQVAQPGRARLKMDDLVQQLDIPRRTLYNIAGSSARLGGDCRRRAQTIFRMRLRHRVRATPDPVQRLFAVFEELDAWLSSEQFVRDQALCARPTFAADLRNDDAREHLAEIDRFAAGLAGDAKLAEPWLYGAFVTAVVAGALGWYDRRAAGRASALALLERLLGQHP